MKRKTTERKAPKGKAPELSASALWRWANGRYKRACASGANTPEYPTMREATKRFACTLDDIENIVGDDVEIAGVAEPYLGIGTAFGVSGGGVASIEARGDYVIEAY